MNLLEDIRTLSDLLVAKKSVRHGRFELASGGTTDIYVDAKLTICSPEAMPLIGRIFLEKIKLQGWSPKAVGGLTLGADPIAFSVARQSLDSGGPLIQSFIVRKEPKKHGMKRYIEGIEETDGLEVVILDDVCTKGDSTALAIERAKNAGMLVLGAVCLVDRGAGATELLKDRYDCQLESVFTLSQLRSVVAPSLAAPSLAMAAG